MKRGIVVKSTGSWYWVRLEEGNMVQCRIRGKFRMEGIRTTNPLAVGDEVELEEGSEDLVPIIGNENMIQEMPDEFNKVLEVQRSWQK